MGQPEDLQSNSKNDKILEDIQSMDFESLFNNFSTLPSVNFKVSANEIDRKLLTERCFCRVLSKEFERCLSTQNTNLTSLNVQPILTSSPQKIPKKQMNITLKQSSLMINKSNNRSSNVFKIPEAKIKQYRINLTKPNQ